MDSPLKARSLQEETSELGSPLQAIWSLDAQAIGRLVRQQSSSHVLHPSS